jgi:uncharacterized protein involved in copper resistance
MKLKIVAAAVVASAFIVPVFAQDKPVTEAPKADAPKAKKNAPSKRHTHMEERHGIKPSDQPASDSKPVDKTKHFHPRDR